MRNKLAILLITIGLLVAILPMTVSGALKSTSLNRSVGGGLTLNDLPRAVSLTATDFNNPSINIKKSSTQVGTIVNTSNQPIKLKVAAQASYTQGGNNKWEIHIIVGTQPGLVYSSTSIGIQWTAEFVVNPGVSVPVSAAYIVSAGGQAVFSYAMVATSLDGSQTYTLSDNPPTSLLRQTYN
jgi:hypothetical protein